MKAEKLIHSLLVCTVFFIMLTVSCSSGARSSETNVSRVEWTRVGIGGGGAQFNPAVSPHDENMAFVSCDMGGSYVTFNGGESWRMFNLGGMVRYFLFDPVDPNIVYALSSGIYKSENKGLTWNLFFPKPSEVVCKVSKGDHASVTWLMKDSIRRSMLTMSIDPTQPKNLYAAIRCDQGVGLYTSVDGGTEWKKEKDFDQDIRNIFIDPSSPSEQRTLYLGWRDGVHQRVNGEWKSYGAPLKNVKFNLLSGGYDTVLKKFTIYAISGKGYFNSVDDTDPGIFISEDGGKTWKNRQDGLLKHGVPGSEQPEYRTISTSAFNPSTIYVSYNNLRIHPDTTCIGVAKSEDYGKTWTFPWKDKFFTGGHITAPNFTGDWLDEWSGPGWGENPFNIAVAPTNANICYGTDFGRTIRTANGGKTWDAVYTKKLPDGSWTSRGIDVTTCYDIAFDPFDENHIFASTTDIGLQESKNGGKGWYAATRDNAVPRAWRNTTYWLTFDPEVKGRVWAVMARDHDLPRPKMFRRGGVEKYMGGVVRSDNSGETWQPVSESIGQAAMTHILLDPTSDIHSRTLYACAFGKGVYKSIDGGSTWVQKNEGIEGAQPFTFRIEQRESDGALFLIVSRRSEDGSIGNDGDGALYKSTDGAETWTKMTLPDGCNGPTDIRTSKKYPKRLVLSAWGRATPGRFTSDIGGGIFISDDEGKTWTQVLEKDQHIYSVSFDERNNRYYACGFNASAYYSEDGAKTWNRIKGYNFKWGHRVTPDPRDENMIFVLTFGGGVWHGPATGDPDAVEDVLDYFETR